MDVECFCVRWHNAPDHWALRESTCLARAPHNHSGWPWNLCSDIFFNPEPRWLLMESSVCRDCYFHLDVCLAVVLNASPRKLRVASPTNRRNHRNRCPYGPLAVVLERLDKPRREFCRHRRKSRSFLAARLSGLRRLGFLPPSQARLESKIVRKPRYPTFTKS